MANHLGQVHGHDHGHVHSPAATQGLHMLIVALLAKQAAGQRDLSMPEVREGITSTLRGRREELLRTAYMEAARDEATVVNHAARRIVESQGKLPPAPSPAAPK